MKTKLLFLFIASILTINTAFAVEKTFISTTGSWDNPANWSPVGVPAADDIITIPKDRYCSVLSGITVTNALFVLGVLNNHAVINVNGGSLYVQNEGVLNNVSGSTITIGNGSTEGLTINHNAVVNNAGTITIDNTTYCDLGGRLNNSGAFTNNGILTVISGVTSLFQGTRYTNPSSARIGFDGAIECITFSAGLTNNGRMDFDLATGDACINYDRHTVSNAPMIFGGTFTATDFGVTVGESYVVMTYPSFSGSFTNSNVDLGGGKYAHAVYSATALTLVITSSPLPVEFLRFEAQHTVQRTPLERWGKNLLTWATATEIRNKEFVVERSENGTNFYPIGTVKSKNRAANYEFIDATPKNGINYYRLKQVDSDGTFSYTKTEAVETGKGKKSIKVFPTNTEGVVFIENTTSENSEIAVFNAVGQLVFNQKSTNQLDLTAMPSGMYFVQVQIGSEKVVEKVFKR
jgi:hypothetical protein